MGEKFDFEHAIGRRIRLRDLHVFLTVTQHGSMAQAAAQLGVSQPAVSSVIADLERTLGVPLFDRSTRGVKPTMYARAMMDRSVAAFDELRQGIRTLENLADPEAGELWIGCVESISGLILPSILQQFMRRYPRVTIHVSRLSPTTSEVREMNDRNLDLVIGLMAKSAAADAELACEPLFDSRLVIAAGAHSHWARRRKLDLGDLADAYWVLTPPESRSHAAITEAFRARGLTPKISLLTFAVPLRMSLVASGPYLTVFPDSIRSLAGYEHSIKLLPIDLPAPPRPVSIITLKSRKLNPVAQRFIAHLREQVAA